MNKAELIEQIAADAAMNKVQANAFIDSLTNAVVYALKKAIKYPWLVSVRFQYQNVLPVMAVTRKPGQP